MQQFGELADNEMLEWKGSNTKVNAYQCYPPRHPPTTPVTTDIIALTKRNYRAGRLATDRETGGIEGTFLCGGALE